MITLRRHSLGFQNFGRYQRLDNMRYRVQCATRRTTRLYKGHSLLRIDGLRIFTSLRKPGAQDQFSGLGRQCHKAALVGQVGRHSITLPRTRCLVECVCEMGVV